MLTAAMQSTTERGVQLVVGSKPWNRRVFEETISNNPGEWVFAGSRDELDETLRRLRPRRIFFLHWSWRVPDSLLLDTECINFHMTDVPYGRGGSPLQNLIVRGHKATKLTALRMTSALDAGPVYARRDLGLHGTAEEVYLRASLLAAEMIRWIVDHDPSPVEQSGEPVTFSRRTPADSEIPQLQSLDEMHDFIRMLDAEGYPRAFLTWRGFRLEFDRVALYDGRVEADVHITRAPSP